MKKLTILFLFFPAISFGQALFRNDNSFLREGNSLYKKSEYLTSEENYRQSLAKNPNNEKAKFNLADALYAQKRYNEAAREFNELATSTKNPQLQAQCFHNIGNSLMAMNKYKEAVEAYKNALRRNPTDAETKYNLAYAQKKLQQQQQQQNQQKKEKEEKAEEKKGEEKDQKTQNKEEEKRKEEQEKMKKEQEEQKSQEKQQGQAKNTAQPSLRKEDSERILDALKTEEEKVKQRLQQQKVQLKTHRNISEKDW